MGQGLLHAYHVSVKSNAPRRHCGLPGREEEDAVIVALVNPLDVRALADIAEDIGRPVKSAVASASELEAAIEKYYG
ncbi:MAG: hypothetical protein R6V58_16900 [Planctomycetota bacterium]